MQTASAGLPHDHQQARSPRELLDLEIQLDDKREQIEAEIEAAGEVDASEALARTLATGKLTTVAPSATISRRAELVQIESLILQIRTVRKDRLSEVRNGQGREFREKAVALQAEASRIRTLAAQHLNTLSDLCGVEYDHSILRFQRCGPWAPLTMFTKKPLSDCGPGLARGDIGAGYSTPKYASLEDEADRLLGLADQATTFVARTDGKEIGTRDELLQKLYSEEVRMWPTLKETKKWFSAVTDKAKREDALFRAQAGGARAKYTLAWRECSIDLSKSFCEIIRVEHSTGDNFGTLRWVHTLLGTYYAD